MARSVTRLQLENRSYQLANMEGATNLWPRADVQERINTHLCEEYDLFRRSAPPDYYSSSTNVTTASGVIAYALPSDFLDLQEVLVQEGASDRLRSIRPFRRGTRSRLVAPDGVYTVSLEYTPTPTSLSADGSTFDGVNGWDELIVALVARDMLIKARESGEQLDEKIGELRARISTMGNRDRSAPRYLRDVDEECMSSINGLAAYRLRAGNIELYSEGWTWP